MNSTVPIADHIPSQRGAATGTIKLGFLTAVALVLACSASGMRRDAAFAQAPRTLPLQPECKAPLATGAGQFDSGVCGRIHGGGGAPPGKSFSAHGRCVTITGVARNPIAGDCDSHGNFRVALPPGVYTVSAGGQTRTLEVKPHQWVTTNFFLPVPAANTPPGGRAVSR